MNNHANLPNELFLDIFERLLDKPSNLVIAMRTCQRWNYLAGTVLYRHISLDSKLREDTPGALFGRFARKQNLVQSLSLRITQVHLMGFAVGSADAFDRLAELCDSIRRMKDLSTFTLFFEESLDHLQGFSVPSAVVVLMLQSLPESVVNLNLDCDCIALPDIDQPHVCHAVGAILPRLKSLRLRTAHICPALFSTFITRVPFDHACARKPSRNTSSLQYAIFTLVARPECGHHDHSTLCHSGDRLLHGAKLATVMHDIYKIGLFPSLHEFAVIGRVEAQHTLRDDNWHVWKIRRFARGRTETITLPYCARGGSSSLYMIRDSEGDWFGSFKDLSSALEGPLAWTKIGLISIRHRGQYEACNDWQLDRRSLTSRDSVIKKFGVSFRLWKHEDATRMRLLSDRKAGGFDDVAVASQTVPAGWQWVLTEGPWNWTIEPLFAF